MLAIRRNAAGAGDFYFRPVLCQNRSILRTPGAYLIGTPATQSTATAQPWVKDSGTLASPGRRGMFQELNQDYMSFQNPSDYQTHMSGCHVFAVFDPASNAANNKTVFRANGAGSSQFIIRYNPTGMLCLYDNGSGTLLNQTPMFVFNNTTRYVLAASLLPSGFVLRVNGVQVVSTGAIGGLGFNPNSYIRFFCGATATETLHGNCLAGVLSKPMSSSDFARLEKILAATNGVTL
jgi:hypothetical protein